ncbi:glycoside hydrolase family 16 protein [Methylobacterium sp. V23]|uniref:glycoside hydrolase family 16 protein n=1 Tax=Methylobacterium sp. V23 TaxID=2044878 RepID=UPI000CDB9720|nr:glycoside hydrolase family 16 protein [Methylobacterium sp. V23]POR42565.1 hypothetical protein CRT23_12305 [Methylobacterium sp. V23]
MIKTTPLPARYGADITAPKPGYVPVLIEHFAKHVDQNRYNKPTKTGAFDTTFFWGARTLGTNGEQQFYIDRDMEFADGLKPGLSPFGRCSKDKGVTITACATPDSIKHKVAMPYVSGLLTTYHSFAFTYGYVEIRAKLPKGAGLWPALWLLNRATGSKGGEIDIIETLGQQPDYFMSTLHWDSNGDGTVDGKHLLVRTKTNDLSADYQTYGLDWNEHEIAVYLNGVKLGSVATPEAFKAPMYLLMNLAVGGWAGKPDPAAFPAEMAIEYVRVWQDRKAQRNYKGAELAANGALPTK